ncbi:MAG: glutathione S-transferase family protein [Rhodospirillales bacterium]
MKFFHSPGSCSLASHVAIEETGAAYESVKVTVGDKSNQKPEYLKINPRGFVPALAVDDWVMSENAAIMLFLAHSFPDAKLLPQNPRALAKCLEWLEWQTNTAHINFAMLWRAERFVDSPADHKIVQDAGTIRIRKRLAEIEAWLAGNEFAAGPVYSVADGMFLVLYRWGWRAGEQVDATTFPHWTAYIKRLSERPAIKRVLQQEAIALLAG